MRLPSSTICTGCMACVDICQHDALSVDLDRDGFFRICKELDKCTDCGLCSRICPVINPMPAVKEAINDSKPYAAWCEDIDLRRNSASGGAFAAIAKFFLENKGIVYGAIIDGFRIRHQRVEDISELPAILGSKYQPSSMKGIYSQVKDDLKKGHTVLFSGLSCQVAGLKRFVGDTLSERLYTIDTICGGVSTMLPIIHLKERGDYKGIVSFRDKDGGWRSKGYKYSLKLINQDGIIDNLGSDNLIIQCFNHKVTKRSSCLDCLFNGFHRMCDASVGDFWGDTRFVDEHPMGVSVLIIHSDRLEFVLNNSSLHVEPVLWNEVIRNNPSVYWTHNPALRHSVTREKVFAALRKGDNVEVKKWMDAYSLVGRIEMSVNHRINERERKSYLKRIFTQ